jgi:hypothetical protein
LDPEEAAALEQLAKAEKAALAKPTTRVLERARQLADRLQHEREATIRRGQDALDEIHRAVRNSGEPPPSLDEINAEIRTVRAAQRAKTSAKG